MLVFVLQQVFLNAVFYYEIFCLLLDQKDKALLKSARELLSHQDSIYQLTGVTALAQYGEKEDIEILESLSTTVLDEDLQDLIKKAICNIQHLDER